MITSSVLSVAILSERAYLISRKMAMHGALAARQNALRGELQNARSARRRLLESTSKPWEVNGTKNAFDVLAAKVPL